MILAAAKSDFEIILYIAAAVWGVISWIRNKKSEQSESEPAPLRQAPETRAEQTQTQTEAAEAERLRKFLEALGVPATQQPPKPVQSAPRPVQPQPRPVRRPQQQRPIPQVAVRKPAPVVEKEEMAFAGRLEEPAHSVEQVGADFDSMAKGMAMQPIPELERRAEADGERQVQPTAVTAKSIHDLLRSPDSLRSALVLREVLGPPRCESL